MHSRRVLAAMMWLTACERGSQTHVPPAESIREKPAAAYPAAFWSTWKEGATERSLYEVRTAAGRDEAIVLWRLVKMSNSRRTEGTGDAPDVFPAMKMNLMRQRGIEERDMLSVFAALESVNDLPAGAVTRAMFSRQMPEGQEWSNVLVHGKTAIHSWHSFREPPGNGQRMIPVVSGRSLLEDALPLCARRIAWPVLRLGEERKVRVIASLAVLRPDIADVTLTLSAARRTTSVAAGSFRTHTFTARWKEGGASVWEVETESPHRIVRWQSRDGETGELREAAGVSH